jgi:glycosyltransferase involved in cell wall biosynthesis
MRFSVVIPVYNRQQPGQRAARSALAQDIEGLEIILVDDGSKPPFHLTPDLAANPNVILLRHDENRGAGTARNTGVAAARGEWIAFLDSDDYWLADTLRPRLQVADTQWKNDPDRLTVHVAGFVIDNRRTGRRDARIPRHSEKLTHFASGCWYCPGSTAVFRKSIFDRIGPFDPLLRRLEDFDWFLRFGLAGGRLDVWDGLAAVVETGRKPRLAILEDSARRLRQKFVEQAGPQRVAPELIRMLDAYLDIERASVFIAQKRPLNMALCIARSLWRVPRLTLQVERFWRRTAVPQRLEPPAPFYSAPAAETPRKAC